MYICMYVPVHCVLLLPGQAMVLFVGRTCFDQELAATLLSFATDDSYKVKRTLACGLHEVHV